MQPTSQNLAEQTEAPPSPSREELEVALDLFALLVDRFGTDYLPFFLRIEKDIRLLDEQQDALTRARALARMQTRSN